MWVLQGAICSWPRDMSFSHCPFPSSPRASLRQALPSPLLQPPLLSLRLFHQTKHHLSGKQLPEAALLEQMPPCPPAQSHCHIHLPGVPHTAPRVCTLPTRVRCPQCRMEVTEPCFLSYIPALNSMGTLGLLCGHQSCSQHLGCPTAPPSLGAAGRCCYPGVFAQLSGPPGWICSPSSQFPSHGQQISSLPAGTGGRDSNTLRPRAHGD